jgi:hypothetical protein
MHLFRFGYLWCCRAAHVCRAGWVGGLIMSVMINAPVFVDGWCGDGVRGCVN